MPIQTLLLTALLAEATVDIPAGTIMCKSKAAADELVLAVRAKPDSVAWLMAGACERINVDFADQRVLASEPYRVVEWTNGIWRRERVVVPTETANRISAGRAKPMSMAR